MFFQTQKKIKVIIDGSKYCYIFFCTFYMTMLHSIFKCYSITQCQLNLQLNSIVADYQPLKEEKIFPLVE